jgi:iron(II)-dependent oxidoreductase
MALVPAGPFLMGHDGLDVGTAAPVHEVQLSAFCIDRFEGGEAEFEECIAIGACRRDSTCDPVPHYVPGSAATCVSLSQAEAYCRWHGKRLPTEAEWEKAARGGCEIVEPPGCGGEDLRPYPWGSEPPDCLRARHGECDDPSPVPVDRLPAGDSPYGARNMVGNVLEWVRDRHASYPTVCPPGSPCVDPVQTSGDLSILRGGGWWTAPVVLSLWKRETSSLTGASWETGVRCAADPVW